MDYIELADELLEKMQILRKVKPQGNIDEALRGERFMLYYIACHGGGVLPGEISNEMDVSSARVAATLNSLENKGLVTRRIDMNDRRKILVEITQEGKELAERHRKSVEADIVRLISTLGEHDARELVRIIGRIAEIASGLNRAI